MIAISNDALYQRFLSACELQAVLDCNLLNALRTVNAFCFHLEHGEMKPFYERFALARNLSTAATEAMKAAAWSLLDRDHVETFFRLVDQSCREAVGALDFAIAQRDDDRFPPFRDRLKAASARANSVSVGTL